MKPYQMGVKKKHKKCHLQSLMCFKKTTRFPPLINNSVVGRRVVRKKFKVEKKDRSSEQTLENSASGQKKGEGGKKSRNTQKRPKIVVTLSNSYIKGVIFLCSE